MDRDYIRRRQHATCSAENTFIYWRVCIHEGDVRSTGDLSAAIATDGWGSTSNDSASHSFGDLPRRVSRRMVRYDHFRYMVGLEGGK